jgi:pyruvate/2-oxoglutarate dehydrogenase complex dihydrolipoamide dehydrogenase (E3) component
MTILKPDLCIIGAGSGGLSLAAGAVQMGASVVLIEGAEMGGDCLNAGCVPSKALLAAGKAAEAMRQAGRFGIRPVEPEIDFAAVKDHVAAVIAGIAPHDSQERFEALGVTVLRDWARFISPREVEAAGQTIRARRFVIATGSRAAIPPIPGIDSVPYLTNETIFALRERPDHLLILGGGPIGMEMAQAHRRLGCRVTVIEAQKALGRDDPETAAVVLEALRAEGVEIREGQAVVRLRPLAKGVEAVLADGTVLTGSHLLVAAGRAPVLGGLGLDAAGVEFTAKGVTVGGNLRSVSNRRVYAMGDAAGGAQFTHVAGAHAGVLIRQILLGLPAKAAVEVPWASYTEPELAQAGLTEAEARKRYGAGVTVLRAEFSGNDRARAELKGKGLVKVIVVKGRPVGASIAGPQAGELIGLWALAIASRTRIGTVAGLILPYPTLGETAKRASGAYFSAKLFDNPALKRIVRLAQRFVP